MSTSPPIRRPPKALLSPLPNVAFTQHPDHGRNAQIIVTTNDLRVGSFDVDMEAMLSCPDPMEELYREYLRRLKAHIEDGCRLMLGRHDCGFPHRVIPGKYINGGQG